MRILSPWEAKIARPHRQESLLAIDEAEIVDGKLWGLTRNARDKGNLSVVKLKFCSIRILLFNYIFSNVCFVKQQ